MYLTDVLLLNFMPFNHYLPLEESAIFLIVQSLLAKELSFFLSLSVLEVLFML